MSVQGAKIDDFLFHFCSPGIQQNWQKNTLKEGCRESLKTLYRPENALSQSVPSKDISLFYIYGFYLVTWSSNLILPRFWSFSFGLKNPLDSPATKSNMCWRSVPGWWGCCLQFYCEEKGHVEEEFMKERRVTLSWPKLLHNPVVFTAVMFTSGSKVLHAVGYVLTLFAHIAYKD